MNYIYDFNKDIFTSHANRIVVYTKNSIKYKFINFLSCCINLKKPFKIKKIVPYTLYLQISLNKDLEYGFNIDNCKFYIDAFMQIRNIKIKRCKFINYICGKLNICMPFYINKIKYDIVLFDGMFPKNGDFRFCEFDAYMKNFNSICAITNGTDMKLACNKINYIEKEIKKELTNYNKLKNEECIYYARGNTDKTDFSVFDFDKAKLIYTVFLRQIYDIIVINGIKKPFVFTLYPGGSFAIDDYKSDKMLRAIFLSPYFRKVIVTQKITYDYLMYKNFCPKEKIEYIFGGVITTSYFNRNYLKEKKYFFRDKKCMDICFVARKQTEFGEDKGYDTFIETAKILHKKNKNIYFHVVGANWKYTDINIDQIKSVIRFYGYLNTEQLNEFYKDKDIILSPNKPFVFGKGYFDGFLTGCVVEATLHYVCAFVSDELELNNNKYINHHDIEIISPDAEKYAEVVEYYYSNPEKIITLAKSGAEKTIKLNSPEIQLGRRIELLQDVLKKEKENTCNV